MKQHLAKLALGIAFVAGLEYATTHMLLGVAKAQATTAAPVVKTNMFIFGITAGQYTTLVTGPLKPYVKTTVSGVYTSGGLSFGWFWDKQTTPGNFVVNVITVPTAQANLTHAQLGVYLATFLSGYLHNAVIPNYDTTTHP